MKKDRNCGMNPYPIYPAYQGMAPGMMGGPMQYPNVGMNMQYPDMGMNNPQMPTGGSSIEQQLSTMNNQINSLERRVSSLESLVGTSNKYNTSNYQVM